MIEGKTTLHNDPYLCATIDVLTDAGAGAVIDLGVLIVVRLADAMVGAPVSMLAGVDTDVLASIGVDILLAAVNKNVSESLFTALELTP